MKRLSYIAGISIDYIFQTGLHRNNGYQDDEPSLFVPFYQFIFPLKTFNTFTIASINLKLKYLIIRSNKIYRYV